MKSVAWGLLVGIFVALSLSFAPHAAAQWIQDGICIYPTVSDEEYTPVCMAYDGSGAVVLVCGRSSIYGHYSEVEAQRIHSAGIALWGAGVTFGVMRWGGGTCISGLGGGNTMCAFVDVDAAFNSWVHAVKLDIGSTALPQGLSYLPY